MALFKFVADMPAPPEVHLWRYQNNVSTLTLLKLQLAACRLFQLVPHTELVLTWYDGGDELIIANNEQLHLMIVKDRQQRFCPGASITIKIRLAHRQLTDAMQKEPVQPASSRGTWNASSERSDVVHWNITCDACGLSDLRGDRFKCLLCDDYDLCSTCLFAEHHPKHPFILVRHTSEVARAVTASVYKAVRGCRPLFDDCKQE